jgi:hypothetical protein
VAKRFTDTDKFIDPWFRRLSSKNKLLWDYLVCNCNQAGIICIDLEFIEMVLNEKYEDSVIKEHFSERLVNIDRNKWFIPKFIQFQYGILNPDSRIHKQIILKLEKEGINYLTLHKSSQTITDSSEQSVTVRKSSYGPKEKEEEKDKEQYQEKEQLKDSSRKEEVEKNLPEIQPKDFRNSKGSKWTPDHVVDLWNGDLGKTNGYVASLGGGTHFRNCLDAFQYLPDQKAWNGLFDVTKKSDFLMGKNTRGWKARLFWLVNYDNAARVLAGEFENGADAEDLYAKIKEQSA